MNALRFVVITFAAVGATAVAAAQQPPAAAPADRAAQERAAAELNARPDTAGTGRFAAMNGAARLFAELKSSVTY